MIKRSRIIYIVVFTCFLLFSVKDLAIPFRKTKDFQENQPPVVKILTPKNNSLFDWDARITYSISVSDKEDGESKYDEINTKEVLLEVRYAGNKKMPVILNNNIKNDPPGLAVMRASNCFNCHNFNSKSLGPSFYDINKRYPPTTANIDSMAKRIRVGASGIWEGKEKMPAHPELSIADAKSTVQWVLKHATDADINYYIGLEGNFRIGSPAAPNRKGYYILTASYTDHGLKSLSAKRSTGQDVVVIQFR